MARKRNSSWSEEECRVRYVEAETNISFRELAEESGFAQSTLKKFSGDDPRGKWTDQRTAFRTELAQKAREKRLEKKGDELANEIDTAQKRHYLSYRVYSEIATEYGKLVYDDIKRLKKKREKAIKNDDETELNEIRGELGKISAFTLDAYSKIQDRSIKGERAALGLDYFIDANAAIQKAESMGYVVLEETDYQELINEVNGVAV